MMILLPNPAGLLLGGAAHYFPLDGLYLPVMVAVLTDEYHETILECGFHDCPSAREAPEMRCRERWRAVRAFWRTALNLLG